MSQMKRINADVLLICAIVFHLRHLWINKILSSAQAMKAIFELRTFVDHHSAFAAEKSAATQARAFPTRPLRPNGAERRRKGSALPYLSAYGDKPGYDDSFA
jgi:hypothetical protein